MNNLAVCLLILFTMFSCQSIKMNTSGNAASISETALNSNDAKCRKAGVKKITNQHTLMEVALEESDPSIRRIAVKKLDNQQILSHIALNDLDFKIRLAAVNNLTSYTLLLEIADVVVEPELKELVMERSEKYRPSNVRIISPRYF